MRILGEEHPKLGLDQAPHQVHSVVRLPSLGYPSVQDRVQIVPLVWMTPGLSQVTLELGGVCRTVQVLYTVVIRIGAVEMEARREARHTRPHRGRRSLLLWLVRLSSLRRAVDELSETSSLVSTSSTSDCSSVSRFFIMKVVIPYVMVVWRRRNRAVNGIELIKLFGIMVEDRSGDKVMLRMMDMKQIMLDANSWRFDIIRFVLVSSFGGRGKMQLTAVLNQMTGLLWTSSTAVVSSSALESFHSKK